LTQRNTTWNFNSSYYEVFKTLKKAFISVLILTYWIPNAQMIVKTDALKYTLTAIFLIITEEKEVYLVTFYSCIFKTTELNYNMYNKKLLAVFKAFYTWCYYLEGSSYRHHYRLQKLGILSHY